jgi:HK97 family phage prohead protease
MKFTNPYDGYIEIDNEIHSLSEFKNHLDLAKESSELKIVKTLNVEIDKSSDNNTVSTIISDGKIDRDNDTINPEGWNVEDYEKNPVVLWSHDSSIPPIAKSKVKVFKSKMTSKDTFAETEFAQTILELVKGGFINAKSVGFVPDRDAFEFDEKTGGFHFDKQSLLEHSYVSVPSNPRALVVARASGVNMAPLISWAEKTLDEWSDSNGVYVPKSNVETLYSAMSNSSVTFDVNTVDTGTTSAGQWFNPIKTDEFKFSLDEEFNVDGANISIVFDDEKEIDSMDNSEDDVVELKGEAKEYLDHVLNMRKIKAQLEDAGFTKDEIQMHVDEIDRLEKGLPEKTQEDVVTIDDDLLAGEIKEALSGLSDLLTEATGKVN